MRVRHNPLNRKQKNGSWTLTSEYMAYRREGGELSTQAWNQRMKEMQREKDE